MESELRRLGFDVARYDRDALIGYPRRSSLELLGPVPLSIAVNGYSFSTGTGPDGVTAELTYVGAGAPTDYGDRDARGRIVVSDGLATPAKALAAAQAGAKGRIHINDGHIHEMCICPVWGTPVPDTAHLLPSLPSVGITRADGDRIMRALGEGQVQARLVTEPFLSWVKIPTLTADLPL